MPQRRNAYMDAAIDCAREAAERGEVPVGAVIVDPETGVIIARAGNRVERDADPSAHAEIVALREAAAKYGTPRLTGLDLYVTLEPCAMCAGALSHARIRRLVFGAYDPKGGAVDHGPRFFERATCHHAPEVIGGVEEARCGALLLDFFRERRDSAPF